MRRPDYTRRVAVTGSPGCWRRPGCAEADAPELDQTLRGYDADARLMVKPLAAGQTPRLAFAASQG